jgi:hypothetical protein
LNSPTRASLERALDADERQHLFSTANCVLTSAHTLLDPLSSYNQVHTGNSEQNSFFISLSLSLSLSLHSKAAEHSLALIGAFQFFFCKPNGACD